MLAGHYQALEKLKRSYNNDENGLRSPTFFYEQPKFILKPDWNLQAEVQANVRSVTLSGTVDKSGVVSSTTINMPPQNAKDVTFSQSISTDGNRTWHVNECFFKWCGGASMSVNPHNWSMALSVEASMPVLSPIGIVEVSGSFSMTSPPVPFVVKDNGTWEANFPPLRLEFCGNARKPMTQVTLPFGIDLATLHGKITLCGSLNLTLLEPPPPMYRHVFSGHDNHDPLKFLDTAKVETTYVLLRNSRSATGFKFKMPSTPSHVPPKSINIAPPEPVNIEGGPSKHDDETSSSSSESDYQSHGSFHHGHGGYTQPSGNNFHHRAPKQDNSRAKPSSPDSDSESFWISTQDTNLSPVRAGRQQTVVPFLPSFNEYRSLIVTQRESNLFFEKVETSVYRDDVDQLGKHHMDLLHMHSDVHLSKHSDALIRSSGFALAGDCVGSLLRAGNLSEVDLGKAAEHAALAGGQALLSSLAAEGVAAAFDNPALGGLGSATVGATFDILSGRAEDAAKKAVLASMNLGIRAALGGIPVSVKMDKIVAGKNILDPNLIRYEGDEVGVALDLENIASAKETFRKFTQVRHGKDDSLVQQEGWEKVHGIGIGGLNASFNFGYNKESTIKPQTRIVGDTMETENWQGENFGQWSVEIQGYGALGKFSLPAAYSHTHRDIIITNKDGGFLSIENYQELVYLTQEFAQTEFRAKGNHHPELLQASNLPKAPQTGHTKAMEKVGVALMNILGRQQGGVLGTTKEIQIDRHEKVGGFCGGSQRTEEYVNETRHERRNEVGDVKIEGEFITQTIRTDESIVKIKILGSVYVDHWGFAYIKHHPEKRICSDIVDQSVVDHKVHVLQTRGKADGNAIRETTVSMNGNYNRLEHDALHTIDTTHERKQMTYRVGQFADSDFRENVAVTPNNWVHTERDYLSRQGNFAQECSDLQSNSFEVRKLDNKEGALVNIHHIGPADVSAHGYVLESAQRQVDISWTPQEGNILYGQKVNIPSASGIKGISDFLFTYQRATEQLSANPTDTLDSLRGSRLSTSFESSGLRIQADEIQLGAKEFMGRSTLDSFHWNQDFGADVSAQSLGVKMTADQILEAQSANHITIKLEKAEKIMITHGDKTVHRRDLQKGKSWTIVEGKAMGYEMNDFSQGVTEADWNDVNKWTKNTDYETSSITERTSLSDHMTAGIGSGGFNRVRTHAYWEAKSRLDICISSADPLKEAGKKSSLILLGERQFEEIHEEGWFQDKLTIRDLPSGQTLQSKTVWSLPAQFAAEGALFSAASKMTQVIIANGNKKDIADIAASIGTSTLIGAGQGYCQGMLTKLTQSSTPNSVFHLTDASSTSAICRAGMAEAGCNALIAVGAGFLEASFNCLRNKNARILDQLPAIGISSTHALLKTGACKALEHGVKWAQKAAATRLSATVAGEVLSTLTGEIVSTTIKISTGLATAGVGVVVDLAVTRAVLYFAKQKPIEGNLGALVASGVSSLVGFAVPLVLSHSLGTLASLAGVSSVIPGFVLALPAVIAGTAVAYGIKLFITRVFAQKNRAKRLAELSAKLGLNNDTDEGEVRRKFRKASLLVHPDKVRDNGEKFKELVKDYEEYASLRANPGKGIRKMLGQTLRDVKNWIKTGSWNELWAFLASVNADVLKENTNRNLGLICDEAHEVFYADDEKLRDRYETLGITPKFPVIDFWKSLLYKLNLITRGYINKENEHRLTETLRPYADYASLRQKEESQFNGADNIADLVTRLAKGSFADASLYLNSRLQLAGTNGWESLFAELNGILAHVRSTRKRYDQ